ncbi:3-Ketodihydrosphingosine Reductase [Manis pentadactyla]|nr:3-Ketodihydrosphingosine Reductase [Manis pentadactyla]
MAQAALGISAQADDRGVPSPNLSMEVFTSEIQDSYSSSLVSSGLLLPELSCDYLRDVSVSSEVQSTVEAFVAVCCIF